MPSSVPTPGQVAARITPRPPAPSRRTPAGRLLSRKAAQQIQELATTAAAVDDAVTHPHSTERTHQRNGTLYVRGDLGVIVPDDDQSLVVGLVRVDTATTPRRRPRRAGGGRARRMPATIGELEQQLHAHGFDISPARGGHRKATRADQPGVTITIPHTPSDSRSYPNLVADIRRLTGIDITADDAQ